MSIFDNNRHFDNYLPILQRYSRELGVAANFGKSIMANVLGVRKKS